jgi:beta-glucosidase
MGPSKHNYTTDDVHSVALALQRGTDINCGECYTSANLQSALAMKLITEDMIDLALRRTMKQRVELGMLDLLPGQSNPLANLTTAVDVDSGAHRALAREMATKSVVLLKNDKGTLPLALNGAAGAGAGAAGAAAAIKNIAVIGPNANRPLTLVSNYPGCKDKPGGPLDKDCTLITPLAGIIAAVKTEEASAHSNTGTSGAQAIAVQYEQGCEIDSTNRTGFEAATAAAAAADVVVLVMGIITCQESGPQCQEAEAKDRVKVDLPGVQLDLLQAVAKATAASGKKLVLVVMGGGTVSIPWAAASDSVHAIIQSFYPGEEGGNALADILFGKANPSGRCVFVQKQPLLSQRRSG